MESGPESDVLYAGRPDGVTSIQTTPTPAVGLLVALTEHTPHVMASVKGSDGRYVFVNGGFLRRVGRPREDVVGATVFDLFPLELARSYAAQDDRLLATGLPLQDHLELIVRADGQLGWYVTSKALVGDSDRRGAGVAALSIDLDAQLTSAHAGLAAVIAAIRADVGQRWTVDRLAAAAGLSRPRFQRLCTATLGLPPTKLVQRLRIERAVRLATTTTLPFGDIAAECGFYDQASFTRQFRAVLGLTPGAYRSARSGSARSGS
ncbi:MAG: helix-turn-helix domain-containing protein [Kineosporiaceae bacterium]